MAGSSKLSAHVAWLTFHAGTLLHTFGFIPRPAMPGHHSAAEVSAMKLEIWSDIACPWCYVGKRRFEQALASFPERDSLEITWRSFELDPSAPRVRPGTAAEHLAGKYRLPLERAEAMNANMTTQGAKEGIEFNFDRLRMGNTFDAHRLIHYAASEGRRTEMVERLFKAYFTEGASLGDHEVL